MGLTPYPRRTQRALHDSAVGKERAPQPHESPKKSKVFSGPLFLYSPIIHGQLSLLPTDSYKLTTDSGRIKPIIDHLEYFTAWFQNFTHITMSCDSVCYELDTSNESPRCWP